MTYKELITSDKNGFATAQVFRAVSGLLAFMADMLFEQEFDKITIKNGNEVIEEADGKPITDPNILDFCRLSLAPSISPRALNFYINTEHFITYLLTHERGDDLDMVEEIKDIYNEWVDIEIGTRRVK